jgi:hypothetical protein
VRYHGTIENDFVCRVIKTVVLSPRPSVQVYMHSHLFHTTAHRFNQDETSRIKHYQPALPSSVQSIFCLSFPAHGTVRALWNDVECAVNCFIVFFVQAARIGNVHTDSEYVFEALRESKDAT